MNGSVHSHNCMCLEGCLNAETLSVVEIIQTSKAVGGGLFCMLIRRFILTEHSVSARLSFLIFGNILTRQMRV